MNILECSSKGDKRFSALYAKINFYGNIDTIENIYQKSKRFNGKEYINPKGYKPTSFIVRDKEFDKKYLKDFYTLLWIQYLQNNKQLIEYAKTFDDYNDIFKGRNTVNCQADIVRRYMREGREVLMKETEEFRMLLNG